MTTTPPILDPTQSRFCVNCGYNLHGLPSDRCPECGEMFSDNPQSQIPWEHRKRVGRVRSFLGTMKLAIFHPGKLARATAGPIDEIAARRFRRIVVVLASVPVMVWLVILTCNYGNTGLFNVADLRGSRVYSVLYPPPTNHWWQFAFIFSAGSTLWGVAQISVLIAFSLAVAAPRRLIQLLKMPSQWHARAAGAGDYLCAPLALLAVPLAAAILIPNLPNIKSILQEIVEQLPLYVLASGLLFLPVWWWLNTIVYARVVSRENPLRGLLLGLCLPVGWAISIAIAGGIFPFLVGFIWLMIDSLRG